MSIEDRVNKMSLDLEKLVLQASIWQSLFDECPIAIAIFTGDMKFYLANEAFCDLTKFSIDDLSGNRIDMVIPPETRKAHKKYEKEYSARPEKKVNRHGLTPYILTKEGLNINVDIDLSYIIYDGRIYYVAFVRRIL